MALVERIRLDLERGLKKPARGRHGIPPAQVLRSLPLMRYKNGDLNENGDYRELRQRIHDGYTLRGFSGFDGTPFPSTMPSTAPSTG